MDKEGFQTYKKDLYKVINFLLLTQDSIPERTVMQVLPIAGAFLVEPKLKEEFLSPDEIRKREEALAAAKAWQEATGKLDATDAITRIKETVSIAPDDSYSL